MAELGDLLAAADGAGLGPEGSPSAAQKDGKGKRKTRKAERAAAAARRARLSQLALPKRPARAGAAAAAGAAGAACAAGARKKRAARRRKPARGGRSPSPSLSPAGREAAARPVGFTSGAVRLTPAPEHSPPWALPGARRTSRTRATRRSGAEGAGGGGLREGLRLLGTLQGELEELSQAHGRVMGVFESRGFVSTSPGRSAVERQLEGVSTLRDLQGLASSIQSKVGQVKTLRQHLGAGPGEG